MNQHTLIRPHLQFGPVVQVHPVHQRLELLIHLDRRHYRLDNLVIQVVHPNYLVQIHHLPDRPLSLLILGCRGRVILFPVRRGHFG